MKKSIHDILKGQKFEGILKNVQPNVYVHKYGPTEGDVHVDSTLSNIIIAYVQEQSEFIADRVFPRVPVMKQSDKYLTIDKGNFFRDMMRIRGASAKVDTIDYTMSNATYFCDTYGLGHHIPDRVRNNADTPVNLDRQGSILLAQQGLIRREKKFDTDFFKSGVWGTDKQGSASPSSSQLLVWNDDGSTPIKDVRTARSYVKSQTGMRVNKMTLSENVWNSLADHPEIIDRITFSQGISPDNPVRVTQQTVAALFELDEILVMGAVVNSAVEGATDSLGFLSSGDHVLLTHTPPAPGLLIPSAGYTFTWIEEPGAEGQEMFQRILRFRDDDRRSDRLEIDLNIDQKQVASDLGYIMLDMYDANAGGATLY